jgi:mono/diheme cytochrome c family protein
MKLRILIALLVVTGCLVAPSAGAQETPKALWLKVKCALCHGEDGSGDTPTGKKTNTPDLRTLEIQQLSDSELSKRIEQGHAKMPSFKIQLTSDQIRLLVFYMRDLARQEAKKQQ